MSEPDYFEEGRKAYKEGWEMCDCPYDGDSLDSVDAQIEWEAGYMEAEEEDE